VAAAKRCTVLPLMTKHWNSLEDEKNERVIFVFLWVESVSKKARKRKGWEPIRQLHLGHPSGPIHCPKDQCGWGYCHMRRNFAPTCWMIGQVRVPPLFGWFCLTTSEGRGTRIGIIPSFRSDFCHSNKIARKQLQLYVLAMCLPTASRRAKDNISNHHGQQ